MQPKAIALTVLGKLLSQTMWTFLKLCFHRESYYYGLCGEGSLIDIYFANLYNETGNLVNAPFAFMNYTAAPFGSNRFELYIDDGWAFGLRWPFPAKR